MNDTTVKPDTTAKPDPEPLPKAPAKRILWQTSFKTRLESGRTVHVRAYIEHK